MGKRPRKNFGERPKGWKAVTVDVPEPLAEALKDFRGELPTASMKLLGTAAFGAYMAMPVETRKQLYQWAHSHELEPEKLNYDTARAVLVGMMRHLSNELPPIESKGGGKDDPNPAFTHYVSRILDPEITPPPGKKRSDKDEGEERKRGAG